MKHVTEAPKSRPCDRFDPQAWDALIRNRHTPVSFPTLQGFFAMVHYHSAHRSRQRTRTLACAQADRRGEIPLECEPAFDCIGLRSVALSRAGGAQPAEPPTTIGGPPRRERTRLRRNGK